MKVLVLFSGTGSIEKYFKSQGHRCRGVDIVSKYNPYYNVDILKWDYKSIDFIPDYIHSSPVCKEFSKLKNHQKRDLNLGNSLFNKSIEIIKYFFLKNKNLVYTIENPVNKFFIENMKKTELEYNIYKTSYCRYGFPYQKNTYIISNIKLILRPLCKKNCSGFKKFKCHRVRIGVSRNSKHKDYFLTNDNQIPDGEYYKYLKDNIMNDNDREVIYNNTSLRYRIPSILINDIYWSIKHRKYIN